LTQLFSEAPSAERVASGSLSEGGLGLGEAPGDLFRTQPAVSVQIRGLESELGHQLFERRQRGVTLTPAGEIVRRRADAILGEIGALNAFLRELGL